MVYLPLHYLHGDQDQWVEDVFHQYSHVGKHTLSSSEIPLNIAFNNSYSDISTVHIRK